MPIYQLDKELWFPHPSLAEDGIVGVGGDLSVDRLLLAYENGIFPWYNPGEPIIWHFPSPRFVLHPTKLKISKSMKQLINGNKYRLSLNEDFSSVIKQCREIKRKYQNGTWISDEMEAAYIQLHKLSFAHSVEVWNEENELVGGLYGVNMGTVFFGESMFHKESNTSKLAFITLVNQFDFSIIDCQVHTKHLESLGAESMESTDFFDFIVKETKKENLLTRNSNFV